MDMFNEVKLIMIMYHMLLFTMFVPDPETRFLIGYSCFVLVILGICINMMQLIVDPIKSMKRNCRLRYHKKRMNKRNLVYKETNLFEAKKFHERRFLYKQ